MHVQLPEEAAILYRYQTGGAVESKASPLVTALGAGAPLLWNGT